MMQPKYCKFIETFWLFSFNHCPTYSNRIFYPAFKSILNYNMHFIKYMDKITETFTQICLMFYYLKSLCTMLKYVKIKLFKII